MWIDSISKHQEYDYNCTYFTICEKHFREEDFLEEYGKKIVKNGSIPTIFERTISDEDANELESCSNMEENDGDEELNADDDLENQTMIICKECVQLQFQLIKARAEIASLKQKKLQLDMIKKELDVARKEVNHLKNINSEIKSAIDVR